MFHPHAKGVLKESTEWNRWPYSNTLFFTMMCHFETWPPPEQSPDHGSSGLLPVATSIAAPVSFIQKQWIAVGQNQPWGQEIWNYFLFWSGTACSITLVKRGNLVSWFGNPIMEIPVEGTPAGIVKVGTSMGWRLWCFSGYKGFKLYNHLCRLRLFPSSKVGLGKETRQNRWSSQ